LSDLTFPRRLNDLLPTVGRPWDNEPEVEVPLLDAHPLVEYALLELELVHGLDGREVDLTGNSRAGKDVSGDSGLDFLRATGAQAEEREKCVRIEREFQHYHFSSPLSSPFETCPGFHFPPSLTFFHSFSPHSPLSHMSSPLLASLICGEGGRMGQGVTHSKDGGEGVAGGEGERGVGG